jgi:FtsP/CotA-like multicopper oxidase with cupredoxin domain
MRLTGSMERYFWTIDGKKFSEARPIQLQLGERVRFTFVNETMMDHPMHLHGMWMNLVNGAGARLSPKKHTISVGPSKTVSADITVDAPGEWVFHCHLLFHMETGMFRRVAVAGPQPSTN